MASNDLQTKQLDELETIVNGTPVLLLASHVSFWVAIVVAACAVGLVLSAHLSTLLTFALLVVVGLQFALTFLQVRLTVTWGFIIEQLASVFKGLLSDN